MMTVPPAEQSLVPKLFLALCRSLIRRGWTGTAGLWLHILLTKLLARLCPRLSGRRFGIREALAFGWRLDSWDRSTRLGAAIGELAGHDGADPISVLDVGAGNSWNGSVLASKRYRVVSVDLKHHLLSPKRGLPIVADGCRLPFRDGSFSIVASADVLEHVPAAMRGRFLAESARVASIGVVLHCPVIDDEGRFDGGELDRRFQAWHVERFGEPEPNTVEHLAAGLPCIEEIRAALPGCRIEPTQPGCLWLDMVRLGRLPGKYLAGLKLMKRIQSNAGSPPYHAALVTYRHAPTIGRSS